MAIEDYTSALRQNFLRPDPEVFAYSCRAHNELDEIQTAIFQCNRAIDLNPESGTGYRYRGDVFHGQGQHRRATEDYETAVARYSAAINLDAGDADAYFGRALAHTTLGNAAEARSDSELAVEHGASPALLEHEISILKGRGLPE